MKNVTKIRRALLTMALSLTMLTTGVSAFARCKGHAMSFEVPGGCTATDSMCMMDRDVDLIRVDMSEINGRCYDLNTLRGLFGLGRGHLGQPGSYEVIEDDGEDSEEMMGRSVTYWGNKVAINWKITFKNTVHTYPEFQVKKGKKIYCSFTYSTPSDTVYMGIADPWDRLTLKPASGGAFSYTFVANYTGGYHFVVANRGYKAITVKGYFKVEK